jgi:serine/threonine protein kinase
MRAGPYELLELIGEGGMGTVYRGRDPRFDRPVAIKALHPQLKRDPDVVERFKAEAVIQAKLNHPNIVSVLDFVADDQHLAIVMEFVEGVPLNRMIEQSRGPLDPDLVVTLFAQALSGIGFAHAKGLVHRDLKPSNILVQTFDDGEVIARIADFGVAKILGTEKFRTATTAKMGTLAYMSSEHLRSPKSVDARSDLYSLGVTLFEALTGQVPFDADTEYELMRQIVETPVPPVRSLNRSLPPVFDAVVARATAKDPPQRFQTAAEFRDALRMIGADGSARAQPALRAPVPPQPEEPPALQAPPAPVRRGSSSGAFSGRALRNLVPWIIVLSFAGGAAVLIRRASENPAEAPTAPPNPARVPALASPQGRAAATAPPPRPAIPRRVEPGTSLAAIPSSVRRTFDSANDPPGRTDDLPPAELSKLRGVAAWSDEAVKLTVYNGSRWSVAAIEVNLATAEGTRGVQLLPVSGRPLGPRDTGTFVGRAGARPESFGFEIESARGEPFEPLAGVARPGDSTPAASNGAGAAAVSGLEAGRALLRRGSLPEAAHEFVSGLSAGARDRLTVSIAVACSAETIRKAVAAAGHENLFVLPAQVTGRDCYRLCWGLYGTQPEAQAARSALPTYFEGATPRVETLSRVLPGE